jgi:hypothetical protein
VIGRHLQRNPLGATAFGSLYDVNLTQIVPVLKTDAAPITQGLRTLSEGLAITQSDAMLNAAQAAARYHPSIAPMAEWTQALVSPSITTQRLEALIALPGWLQTSYNRAGVQLDLLSGVLTLETDGTLGQSASTTQPPAPNTRERWLPTTPTSPLTTLRSLAGLRDLGSQAPTSYQAWAWQAAGRFTLKSAWDMPAASYQFVQTPSAVMRWLPAPLAAPAQQLATLRLVEQLQALPHDNGQAWVKTLVIGSLPAQPQLPPPSAAEWRERWFTDDVLGLGKVLGRRTNLPAPPDVPVYGIGYNQDWLFVKDTGIYAP